MKMEFRVQYRHINLTFQPFETVGNTEDTSAGFFKYMNMMYKTITHIHKSFWYISTHTSRYFICYTYFLRVDKNTHTTFVE